MTLRVPESRPLPWLDAANELLARLAATQGPAIEEAARWCADAIAAGGLVHLFGTGHSRIPVEEMFPRYGSFPGFHPIVELSMTFHSQGVGANGQRQAMFLENVSGLAERILRNYALAPTDTALVISSSGCNVVPIEMAEGFHDRGVKVGLVVGMPFRQQHSYNLLKCDACFSDVVTMPEDAANAGDQVLTRLPRLEGRTSDLLVGTDGRLRANVAAFFDDYDPRVVGQRFDALHGADAEHRVAHAHALADLGR